MKFRYFALTALVFLLLGAYIFSVDDNIVLGQNSSVNVLNPWKVIAGYIKPRDTTNGLQVPSLASSNDCLITDATGKVSTATCGTGGSFPDYLSQVGDVSTTSLDTYDLLWYDGVNWSPVATTSLGITGGSGVTDHGALTGLLDNDHPQYLTLTDWYSTTTSDLVEGTNLYYTDSRVGSYISGSSTVPHVGGTAVGDILKWTGSAWTTMATSGIGYLWGNLGNIPAGFADGVDDTGGTLSGGSTNVLTYWTSGSTVGATSSPTVGYVTATSTTASQFPFASSTGISATTLWGALIGNVTGNVSGTAGSLGANGGNCTAGNFPLGVDASGAIENCTDAWTEAENTSAGYITSSALSPYLSLSAFYSTTTQDIAESGNLYYTDARVNSYIHSSTTIPKTYTANTFTGLQTVGNASTTHISVSGNSYLGTVRTGTWNGSSIADAYIDDTITASNYLTLSSFYSTTTSDIGEGTNLYYTDARVNSYIHSSTTIPKTYTANTFTGLQTIGNASTTHLSVSGNSYLGTVQTGTWNGTAIGDTYLTKTGDWTGTIDGNNFTGGAIGAGQMLYGTGAGTLGELTLGASSTIMTNDGTSPRWLAGSALCVAITGSAGLCDGTDDGGVGSQTPWTSAINGAGYALSNVGAITGTTLSATSTTGTSTFAGSVKLTATDSKGGWSAGDGMLNITNNNVGTALKIDSSSAGTQDSPLLYIAYTGGGAGANLLRIDSNSVSSQEQIRFNGLTNGIEMVETDQANATGKGKWEIYQQNNIFGIGSRMGDDSGFEKLVGWTQTQQGGAMQLTYPAQTYGISSEYADFSDRLQIVGGSASTSVPTGWAGYFGISSDTDGSTHDGTPLRDVFVVNYNGRVGIGTSSPYAKLSIAGLTVAERFTATSTTPSVFPFASTTVLSASSALCISTDCRTSWPAGSTNYWTSDATIGTYLNTNSTSSAPVFVGTSTVSTSTFPRLSATTAFTLIGDYITNVATWFDAKIEALTAVVLQGTWDFGGATSLEIVNGTGPTVDTLGEIALDTTDDQLLVADSGGTVRVFATDEFRLISTTIASSSLAFASGQTLAALGEKDGIEITQYRCYVVGGTSKVVNLTDGTNDTETITCATTMTSDTDVATNDTFTADELGYLEMGATTGSVNYLHFEAWARITRE